MCLVPFIRNLPSTSHELVYGLPWSWIDELANGMCTQQVGTVGERTLERRIDTNGECACVS
ncbi:hypothetical protein BofuT4_uP043180.1 [Botrytis cinerea T4]|uniref:Uncharacterized protein n=1 Tax=Botryotinia fuckeliana (strain T4) TaxID=999810 RepID=G2Y217_BOTF4|nr:hypothetical protein BofuT4_uP043180.1 [Botrytis cinerea T4]